MEVVMEFSHYQSKAELTVKRDTEKDVLTNIFICGLTGEAGSVASCHKKKLRDTDYSSYENDIKEEMGDVLWYLSALAINMGINLDEIATLNLEKVESLGWSPGQQQRGYSGAYDAGFPKEEQFPNKYTVRFEEIGGIVNITWVEKNKKLGNNLTDARNIEDDYRFHDVFHMSYSVYLGWSPLMRGNRFLNCKRRSRPKIDQNEDGGRAWVIEEAISAVVFNYAKTAKCFENTKNIDYSLLKIISRMVEGYEVSSRDSAQWTESIITGYEVFNKIRENRGGVVTADILKRELSYETIISYNKKHDAPNKKG